MATDAKPVTAVDIRRAVREYYGDSAAVFDEIAAKRLAQEVLFQ